ncbi:MAG: ribokinase [Paenibacillus sp.]|jgi:ribokinase|nr:ribokinase [Paenibacillus sp.]
MEMSGNPSIVVVGSLNMDIVLTMSRMPQVGETVAGQHIHYVPGGKGANQAVGCAKLGADTAMVGAVGGDSFGSQLLDNMSECGVHTEAVTVISQTATGTAAIFHTKEDNCIVVVPGANETVTPEYIERHRSLIQSADLVLLQLEIPIPAVRRALELAREAGVRTVLNPAPVHPDAEQVVALADVLTPNESEFALLCGQAADTEEALRDQMRQWQQTHSQRLVVTRGKAGAACLDEQGELHTIPSLPVEVVDTTGAGDTLNAALSVGLASGRGFREALEYAVKAASLSVRKFGAQGGMPTREEMERIDAV